MLSSLSQKASYFKSVNPIHNAFSNEYYNIRESSKLSFLSKLFSFERNEIKTAIYCFYLNEQLGAKKEGKQSSFSGDSSY